MNLDIFTVLGTLIFSWVISWFVAKGTIKMEKNKINRDFSLLLIEKRLEYYPSLWELVSDVYWFKKIKKLEKDKKIKDILDKNLYWIRPKLREWRKKYGIYLSKTKRTYSMITIESEIEVVEISSLAAFQKLEDALFLDKKYKNYDNDKILKIDKYRNILINCIQSDIWILENSENKLRNII